MKKIVSVMLLFFFLSILNHESPLISEALAQVKKEAPKRRQRVKPPVMKSVFWNTLMGSAWGALIGVTGALTMENFRFNTVRESVVIGTTFGGIIGYGFGIFLVLKGISFDPQRVPFAKEAMLTDLTPLSFPGGASEQVVALNHTRPPFIPIASFKLKF